MFFTSKISIICSLLIAVFLVILFYRNYQYDRTVTLFGLGFFVASMIEYALFNDADPNNCGELLFVVIILQVFLLTLGVYWCLNRGVFSLGLLVGSAALVVIAITYALTNPDLFNATIRSDGLIDWTRGDDGLLGWAVVPYVAGIVGVLLLLVVTDSSIVGTPLLWASILFLIGALIAASSQIFSWGYIGLLFLILTFLLGGVQS